MAVKPTRCRMEKEIIFEQESEAPENWIQEVIYIRDGKGSLIEVKIPDAEEG